MKKLSRIAAASVLAIVATLAVYFPAPVFPRIPWSSLPVGETPSQADDKADSHGYTEHDLSASPQYYRVIGKASVVSDLEPGKIRYSDLDRLGRAGRCTVNVTFALMEEGVGREREDMSALKPSGWGHNRKVDLTDSDGKTKSQYFYNRSHLIAHFLGGEERIENVVCATRFQNVGNNGGRDGGMAFCEGLARDYLASHQDGSLVYSACPVYEGDELVCRSVIVDILSADGELDLEVEVYNAANGYSIDYATGDFT